jgi:hypothetical protein
MFPTILVATADGCRVFLQAGEARRELPGRAILALAPAPGGACLAIVDGTEAWRREADGHWRMLATIPVPACSVLSCGESIYLGAMADAQILRLTSDGALKLLAGLDRTAGRETWFGNGPPLHVRSLAATRGAILAAIHVGGIARSRDEGESWEPTLPVLYDVHELCAHPSLPLLAAACAVGLAVSRDGGKSWLLEGGPGCQESLA